MARRYYKRKRYSRYPRGGLRGRGDYRDTLKSIGKYAIRGLGAAGGALAGYGLKGFPGVGDGMKYGWKGGEALSQFVGLGDYWNAQPVGNQIIAGGARKPMMVNQSRDLTGDVYVTHREYIGPVQANYNGTSPTSGFQLVQYPINAAMQNGFPWLSQIAQNFVLYEFQGLIYEFRPTSGEFGATNTNAVGKVIMATQYDPDAKRFTDDITMENYDYAMSCKPSIPMRHGVECKKSQKSTNMLYCRSGAVERDKIFTDLGTLCVAVSGIPVPTGGGAGQVILGELWVTYKVKLSRAQVFDSVGRGLGTGRDDIYFKSNASTLCGDTSAGVLALPNGPSLYQPLLGTNNGAQRNSNTLGGTVTSIATNSFTYQFPSNISTGTFMVQIMAVLPAAAANGISLPGAWSLTSMTAVGITGVILVGTANQYNSTAAEQVFGITAYVAVNAPGQTIASFTPTTTNACAAGTAFSVVVTECPAQVAFGPDYWLST